MVQRVVMAAARGPVTLALAAMVLAAPSVDAATQAGAPWRDRLGLAGVAAPTVRPSSPFLALIDSPVDLGHPAFTGAPITSTGAIAPFDLHGTATAATATATGAGGLLGVWPGMRVRSYPFTEGGATCEQTAELISRAVTQGAATINMSFGSDTPCFAELAALQQATRRGVILVAAAGNDRLFGNARHYPAAYPHVITVAALGDGDSAAAFSGTSSEPSLAAPGTNVLTAVPLTFDPDPIRDGWARLSGTSFAAPMVAAAATWLRATRPSLTATQIASLICSSARDLPPRGWDRRTGCGSLDLTAALRRETPAPDPGEPNDEIRWVDGLTLSPATRSIWRGGAPRSLHASVGPRIDPIDVYRILRPPHSRTHITLKPTTGGADLRALDEDALSSTDASALLAASRRKRQTPDDVTIVNRENTSRIAYVVISDDPNEPSHRTTYTIGISRTGPR